MFSRLPREQRIAQILYDVIKPMLRTTGTGYEDASSQVLVANDWPDLIEVAEELAQYSVRDFAVRYCHLADGERTGVYGKKTDGAA